MVYLKKPRMTGRRWCLPGADFLVPAGDGLLAPVGAGLLYLHEADLPAPAGTGLLYLHEADLPAPAGTG